MPEDPARIKSTKDEDDADYELELTAVPDGRESTHGQPAAGGLGGEPIELPRLVSFEPPKRFKGKLFSLKNNSTKRNVPNFVGATGRSFNYEEMYEEDAYGEEAFPEARVWKVYNDEAQLFDLERIEAWRDAIDVLLVFIGLFAAVVSAFLIETSKSLQPDYGQINVMISYAILRSLNGSVLPHATLSPNVIDPHFGEASKDNSVVSALWYTSLTISLSTALLAMLIKQWLHHFMTSTSGTARERARNRQFRHAGLEIYRVPLIIDLLPTLLHVALGLFLVGLAIYLKPLSHVMFGLVVAVSGVPYLFYFVTITMPFFDPQCPYRSPPSFYIYPVQRYLTEALRPAFQQLWVLWVLAWGPIHTVIAILCQHSRRQMHHLGSATRSFRLKVRTLWSRSNELPWISAASFRETGADVSVAESTHVLDRTLSSAEKQAVSRRGRQLDVGAIVYLCNTSSNTNVRNIALEAFGGLLPLDSEVKAVDTLIRTSIHDAIQSCRSQDARGNWYDNLPMPGMEHRHDRLLRAICVRKQVNIEHHYAIRRGSISLTDPRKIYSSTLLPLFGYKLHGFSGVFAFFVKHSFPPSIWIAIVQLAERQEPAHPVVRAILVAALHLPLDSHDMGSVTFSRAMQNPYVRSIGLAYLGVLNIDKRSLLSLSLSSVASLLPTESEEMFRNTYSTFRVFFSSDTSSMRPFAQFLSSILPPVLHSISQQLKNRSLGNEDEEMLRGLLTDFFQLGSIDDMSWELLFCVLRVWSTPSYRSIRVISSPSAIREILRQFRHRGRIEAEDVEWAQQAVKQLDMIVHWSSRDEGLAARNVSEVLYSCIRDLDLLPIDMVSQDVMSTFHLFWSGAMCTEIGEQIHKHHETRQGLGWFEAWLAYIHAPARLAFLCSRLIASNNEHLPPKLCQVRPQDPGWPAVIKTLLLLLNDQTYLESMVDWRDQEILHPRQRLSQCLLLIKTVLQEHHPALSQPEYDIPMFHEEYNLIPGYSNTNLTINDGTTASCLAEPTLL